MATESPDRDVAHPGQIWIMPVAADDIVPVTERVLSYETDGVLHLAESVGTITQDGLTFEMVTD
jgi:hypothetical protein